MPLTHELKALEDIYGYARARRCVLDELYRRAGAGDLFPLSTRPA